MNKGKNLNTVCSGIQENSAISSRQFPRPKILKQQRTLCSKGIITEACRLISNTLAKRDNLHISSNKTNGTLLII